jgi:molybdopterin/thiamine biosynthesis adenylyltransferase
MEFSDDERARYARQLVLEGFGEQGQQRLRDGSVLVIGAGGLGSPVAYYLAAAGVGRLGIIDGDVVDTTNLQRQILHRTADVGRQKAISAKEKLEALNPNTNVEIYTEFLTTENGPEILAKYDFVVDATDSFRAKFMINDLCVAAGKPFSHGGIYRYQGHTMTYVPGAPCYRCLFSSMPTPEAPQGPIGAVAGIIGCVQAAEAIKYLSGAGTLLTGTLLTVDTRTMEFNRIRFSRSADCASCAGR